MSPTIQDIFVSSSICLMNSAQYGEMEMSYLSIHSRKLPHNLTVLYLQLISDKVFGKTNDINSDEVRSTINQIQYLFLHW